MSRVIGNSGDPRLGRWRGLTWLGVQSSSGHHCGCSRGSLAGRGGSRLQRVEGVGFQAARPVPHRGRRGVRAAIATTERSPNTTPATTVELILDCVTARRRRPRRRRRHDHWHLAHDHQLIVSRPTVHRILRRPADHTRSPRNGRARRSSGSKPSCPTRCGRPTSPTGASPTAPTSRSCAGSTTTPATRSRSPPTSCHRPHRHRHLHQSPRNTRCPSLHTDRQRHGLHDSPLRRPRRPQRLRDPARHLGVVQKNSRPNHPTTCGKVERFHQTLKTLAHRPPHRRHHRRTPSPARPVRRRIQPAPPAQLDRRPHPDRRLQRPTQSHPHRQPNNRTTASAATKSATATSPSASAATCTTSASAATTTEPPSSCSSTTSTSASSTPPPAKSSAPSRSTPTAATTAPEHPSETPQDHEKPNRPNPDAGSDVSDVLRHHMVPPAGFEPATHGLGNRCSIP